MKLTCDDDFGSSGLDLPEGRPGDALASVSIESKVLFDVVAGDVHFDLDLADARHRVDVFVIRVMLAPHGFAVTHKVDLQSVSGAARESRRFALEHVRILRLLEEERNFRSWSARRQRIL